MQRMVRMVGAVGMFWGTLAQGVWPFSSRPPLPCSVEILSALHLETGLVEQMPEKAFLEWAATLAPKTGHSNDFIGQRYLRLALNGPLMRLMQGIDLTPTERKHKFSVSGAWGSDYMLAPNRAHWERVTQNFDPLIGSLQNRRRLLPLLADQLLISDHTSLGDAAWIIATTRSGEATVTSSVKILFFDYDLTPDSPWPRYAFTSPLPRTEGFVMYQLPQELTPFQAELAEDGHYRLGGSLERWGLFPAETQSNYLLPEHQSVLSPRLLMIHMVLMNDVIEAHGRKEVVEKLETLMRFRNAFIPQSAREIAELGRFNIPPNSEPGTKAQLFYGLTVALAARPIKTVVAFSPRPAPRAGERVNRPSWEILTIAPGWEWLAEAARQTAGEWDRERGINQGPFDEPKRDRLRDSYEELGLEVVHTVDYAMGLPNGGHVMRAPRDRFLAKIIEYQLQRKHFLLPEQIRAIQKIAETLQP